MVRKEYDLVHYRVRHTSSNYFFASTFLAVAAGAADAGLAGAVTAGLASAFFSSFLGASAAKEVKAKTDSTIVNSDFILSFL
jgi:hypothetical protein